MHVIVRYVQEALKFKLHFNSSLNAEATCEKCLHMCGMAGDAVRLLLLLVLVLMMVFLLLLVIVLQLMLLLLLKLHCHSHTHTHAASSWECRISFWALFIQNALLPFVSGSLIVCSPQVNKFWRWENNTNKKKKILHTDRRTNEFTYECDRHSSEICDRGIIVTFHNARSNVTNFHVCCFLSMFQKHTNGFYIT